MGKKFMLLIGFQILVSSTTLAHEGYFTTYSHHIEEKEKEVMIFLDFTSPSQPKREEDQQGEYFSQMVELKYNPTSQLALEFMWEGFEDVEKGNSKFTGFRYETRYKLFKNDVPLNPTLYAEFEDLHLSTRYKMEVSGWVNPPYEEETAPEPNREKIFESRLILSQDIGSWNYAFNWINESDLQAGETAFGYSLGALYRIHKKEEMHHFDEHMNHVSQEGLKGTISPASIAFELSGALGDTKKFGLTPSRQEHYFQPSMSFHVGRYMLGVGYAMGLTRSSDDVARFNWGWKL